MSSGTKRGPDFENAIVRLWNDNLPQSKIVTELERLGWPVTGKIVRYYAYKLGLYRRRPYVAVPSNRTTTALSDQERAMFFRGLEKLF
jgi:hypothetical protein